FAHNAHVVDEPVRGGIWDQLGPRAPRLMGSRLREALGDRLRILVSASASDWPGHAMDSGHDMPDIDAALSRLGTPHFLLDLRPASKDASMAPWLQRPRTLRANVVTEFEVVPA